MGYITSVRFLYFGLPLGAEILRRAGFIPAIACFGHRMPGLTRARTRLARARIDARDPSRSGAREAPLLLFKPDLDDPGVRATLASARPDVLLSWFWPNRIPEAILALAPRGAFGVHPSLLPRHRGPDPYFHAILAGDRATGVTLHRLDGGYDTGHVVAQRELTIGPEDDAYRLARRLDRPSLALLLECARRLDAGEALLGEPQDEARATLAPQPEEDELSIDWDAPLDQALCLVRAASPAPLASVLLGDRLVFVRRARAFEGAVPDVLEPGDALRTPEGVAIVCGDGRAILLVEVELEDGERVRERGVDRLVPDA